MMSKMFDEISLCCPSPISVHYESYMHVTKISESWRAILFPAREEIFKYNSSCYVVYSLILLMAPIMNSLYFVYFFTLKLCLFCRESLVDEEYLTRGEYFLYFSDKAPLDITLTTFLTIHMRCYSYHKSRYRVFSHEFFDFIYSLRSRDNAFRESNSCDLYCESAKLFTMIDCKNSHYSETDIWMVIRI